MYVEARHSSAKCCHICMWLCWKTYKIWWLV